MEVWVGQFFTPQPGEIFVLTAFGGHFCYRRPQIFRCIFYNWVEWVNFFYFTHLGKFLNGWIKGFFTFLCIFYNWVEWVIFILFYSSGGWSFLFPKTSMPPSPWISNGVPLMFLNAFPHINKQVNDLKFCQNSSNLW